MRILIETTSDEIAELIDALQADRRITQVEVVDPQRLTRDDPRRYRSTGPIGNYGEEEMVDVRTGRRGVYHNAMGMGFVPGSYVDSNGNVQYEHPWNNPLQGCRW